MLNWRRVSDVLSWRTAFHPYQDGFDLHQPPPQQCLWPEKNALDSEELGDYIIALAHRDNVQDLLHATLMDISDPRSPNYGTKKMLPLGCTVLSRCPAHSLAPP